MIGLAIFVAGIFGIGTFVGADAGSGGILAEDRSIETGGKGGIVGAWGIDIIGGGTIGTDVVGIAPMLTGDSLLC